MVTFLPKNLYEQFKKMANVYFLIIAIMQTIDIISISGGKPVMLMPLSFVIIVSMIKDIFEDFKRHKSDHQENFKKTWVYDGHDFKERHWQDVRVGDLVRVPCDQFFPADMVLVESSDPKGVCYIETKNLDGETNLKHKIAEKWLNTQLHQGGDFALVLAGSIDCEEANDQIYKFEGTFNSTYGNKKIVLSSENLLLRGSSLRNTDWALGVVVYSGHQTKIMMNSSSAKFKMSGLEKGTNKHIIQIFCVQTLLCFIAAIFGTFYQLSLLDVPYLDFRASVWETSWPLMIIKQTGTWILIFT